MPPHLPKETWRTLQNLGVLWCCQSKTPPAILFWTRHNAVSLDSCPRAPSPRATGAVARINRMFFEDSKLDGMAPAEKAEARRRKLKPLMDAFHEWAVAQRRSYTAPGMNLATAFDNAISQWPGFAPVFDDGRIPLDNNLAERAIRPFAIGRKNWLFSDTVRGADASAAIYSIVTTAKANGLDAFRCLEWLFAEMPGDENLGDPEAARRYLPWSDAVPESCFMPASQTAEAGEVPDDPVVDIDPYLLEKEREAVGFAV